MEERRAIIRSGRKTETSLNMARAALIREGEREFRRVYSEEDKSRGRWAGPPIQEVKNALKKLPPI